MEGKERYHFETFSGDPGSFDALFSDFVNKKYHSGWKYKECQYQTDGGKRYAFCLFKRMI